MVAWVLLALVTLVTASMGSGGIKFTDEQYYQMPKLFHLDDYDACFSRQDGAFCLGTFDLIPLGKSELFDFMKEYSKERVTFNHTRLHRGYCVSVRCKHIHEPDLRKRFEKCVDEWARSKYEFRAKLHTLNYCKTSDQPRTRPIDGVDMGFAYFIGIVLLLNLIGTLYDLFRNINNKPNRYFMSWSLMVNWNRMTASYEGGNPKLSALNPLQGMKAITLMLVMLAHTVLSTFTSYIYNPEFLERTAHHPLTSYLHNGSVIVQTFVMVSSFLLAYNLLLTTESDPKKQISMRLFANCLFHRIFRIIPIYIFVIGLSATWWVHLNDGPLWTPLVEAESAVCRSKWWTHLLFVNNFVRPDEICLIQTWFLAVDMQLYIIALVLTLLLGRWPRTALKVFAGLFVASVMVNFFICYKFGLKAIIYDMDPEIKRTQYAGVPSFIWFYSSPWGSLPASLLGLCLAFLHHLMQQAGFNPADHKWIRISYRLSVPAMFLWVLTGYWMADVTSPLAVAGYTALNRPAFVLCVAVAMIGFFNKIDKLWWEFLSWRGWRVLGRMSLSVLLVHWSCNLMQLAVRNQPALVSVLQLVGDWFMVMFVTYVAALPLHLLVELPLQKFLQSIAS